MLEETKEHFRHAAFHDSLTGLPNRAMFTELLKAEIESSKRRDDHMFAVLFLDLDRFKNINDSLGHTHGDLLLVAFAERLERTLRPVDTLARFGGDEFAILLSGMTDATDAVRVAQRIQDELSQPFVLDKNSAFATASIGIALSSSGYDRPEDILRDADIAMYRAKENGKARYEVFDHGMHARAVSRLQMESDLRQAIEQQGILRLLPADRFARRPDVSRVSKRSCAGTIRVAASSRRRFHSGGGRDWIDRADWAVGVE